MDFGPGEGPYKFNFANKTQPIIRGRLKLYTLKEKIKSIDWLYTGIKPFVRMRRGLINQFEDRLRKLHVSH
jgi:CelD/BcsL family acetyltransferase involved in cellulose biosynthesis